MLVTDEWPEQLVVTVQEIYKLETQNTIILLTTRFSVILVYNIFVSKILL